MLIMNDERERGGFKAVAFGLWCVVSVFTMTVECLAEDVTVALATNFLNPFKELTREFEQVTNHRVRVSSGSSGKLYAQILHGAPFDIFFSADSERPQQLEKSGLGVQGRRFTYAIGQLALWTAKGNSELVDGLKVLRLGSFRHLAISNPVTAPYGRAARQTLESLDLWSSLRSRIVQGENVGQTFQFVITGNAEWGLIAFSSLNDPRVSLKGSYWKVPMKLYDSLEQDVILLSRGESNVAALALLEFIQRPVAQSMIQQYGYLLLREKTE
ncbi:MAG: molybdate ABC transporter substrate-binding protein [Nitrospirales bacterium]